MKQFIKNTLKKVEEKVEAIYEALKSPGPPLFLSLLSLLLVHGKLIYKTLGDEIVTREELNLALECLSYPLFFLIFWAIGGWEYHKQKKDKPNE